MDTPQSVPPPMRATYIACNDLRLDIKDVATKVNALRVRPGEHDPDECRANIELAYRHLEDASMRFGKALQALDGGVSVYDRATTVGA